MSKEKLKKEVVAVPPLTCSDTVGSRNRVSELPVFLPLHQAPTFGIYWMQILL